MAKSKDEKKRNGIIPEPTLRRLPWYLSFVKLLQTEGHKYVSSPRIASGVGVDAALVAKDLSYVELQGRTRVGYETEALINYLEEFLGFTKRHQAFLVGVGSLGSGLLSDKGLRQFGLEVTAGFDVAEDIIGTEVSGIPVYHIDELATRIESEGIKIAILTVPILQAQLMTDRLGACWYPCAVELYARSHPDPRPRRRAEYLDVCAPGTDVHPNEGAPGKSTYYPYQ